MLQLTVSSSICGKRSSTRETCTSARSGDALPLGDAPELDHRDLEILGGGLRHREGGGDALVRLGCLARLAQLLHRPVAQVHDVEPLRAAVERARGEAGDACGDDAALQLPDEIAAPVLAARELLARRVRRGELEEQRLGACRLGRLAQPHGSFARASSTVRKTSRASDTSTCSNTSRCPGGAMTRTCSGPPSRGSARSVTRYCARRCVSRAHEHGERLRHHVDGALEPREAQPPIVDVALRRPARVAVSTSARPPRTPRRAASAGASSGTE